MTTHLNRVREGGALLQSRWPTRGLGSSDIAHGRCLARFASAGGRWVAESDQEGLDAHGQGDPLGQLDRILLAAGQRYPAAGAIGYIAYEAGYDWVGLTSPEPSPDTFCIPEIQFLIFDSVATMVPRIEARLTELQRKVYSSDYLHALAESASLHAKTEYQEYVESALRIKEHIKNGDIYQANFTQAFDIETERAGLEIYETLAASNPAPFAAYLHFPPLHWCPRGEGMLEFPEVEIISNSPERFWKKTGLHVETRPIKGTIARGETSEADRLSRRQLLLSAKDRAELLMITDLERNDLGRFAETGSVEVQALRRVRGCPSIWHLESLVTARVDPDIRWHQIMQSMFPGGSITGAPKRRAMEILRELEPVPRGVYCGAIGWVTAAGDADFSIAIRTAVKIGKMVRVHGGGGIVADSDPMSEYLESLIKIAPILECLCR